MLCRFRRQLMIEGICAADWWWRTECGEIGTAGHTKWKDNLWRNGDSGKPWFAGHEFVINPNSLSPTNPSHCQIKLAIAILRCRDGDKNMQHTVVNELELLWMPNLEKFWWRIRVYWLGIVLAVAMHGAGMVIRNACEWQRGKESHGCPRFQFLGVEWW